MSDYAYGGTLTYRSGLIHEDTIAAAELGALSLANTTMSHRYLQSLEFTLRELRSIL